MKGSEFESQPALPQRDGTQALLILEQSMEETAIKTGKEETASILINS